MGFHRVKANNEYVYVCIYIYIYIYTYCRSLYFKILYLWPDGGPKRQKHTSRYVSKRKVCCVPQIAHYLCLNAIMFSFKELSQNIYFFRLVLLSDIHAIYSRVVTIFITIQSCIYLLYNICTITRCGPGSSVGIATDYRLEGPGSNPGEDEIFRLSRPALGPTQPPVKWVPGLSQG